MSDTAPHPTLGEPALAGRLYVYGLIRAGDAPADPEAFAGLRAVAAPQAPVIALASGPLAAIASPIDAADVMATRRHMLAHAKVLEAVMAERPILPMRFGVITATAADLHATLAPEADGLCALLDELDGRVEMGVKAVCDEAAVMRAIVADRPDIAERYAALKQGDPAATQFQRVDLGREVAGLRAEWRDAERERLIARFADVAERVVVHEPDDDDLLVFNAAFLLKREDEPALFARVEALDADYGEALTLKYVGPVPPYNFVNTRLSWTPPEGPAAAAPPPAADNDQGPRDAAHPVTSATALNSEAA